MSFLGVPDIPTQDVNYFRDVLKGREQKLVDAKAQRDRILNDIRKASVAIDAGDQRARFLQGSLNKDNVEAGRLILSLEREVGAARKRVEMAEDQAAGAAAKRAAAEDAALVRDKWFEVVAPDGRKLRHRHASAEALGRSLQPGYSIVGQVHGASDDGLGGFVAGANSNMMKILLDSYGDELLVWLSERGIVAGDKTVVILPPNGREKMQ